MRRSAAAVPRPVVRRAAYCLAVRRCAARPPVVQECTDAPTSPAGCPGGHQPWGATRGRGSARCRGRRRGAKKSLFAPGARWLVSTGLALLPGAANAASLKPRRGRSCALSRLVTTSSREPALLWLERVACMWWRYCVWPSSCATACGRRPRCFTSGGCEATTLENALLSAFQYTLCIHARSSWLSWRAQALAPPCQPGGEEPQRSPAWRSRPVPQVHTGPIQLCSAVVSDFFSSFQLCLVIRHVCSCFAHHRQRSGLHAVARRRSGRGRDDRCIYHASLPVALPSLVAPAHAFGGCAAQ